MAGLNIDDYAEEAVIGAFLADAYFIDKTIPVIHYHDDTENKELPCVIVHCHELKWFENSRQIKQANIEVTIMGKIPDNLDHSEIDDIAHNVLRILETVDLDVYDNHLPVDADFAFNGFVDISFDEKTNEDKREFNKIIIADTRFWMQ